MNATLSTDRSPQPEPARLEGVIRKLETLLFEELGERVHIELDPARALELYKGLHADTQRLIAQSGLLSADQSERAHTFLSVLGRTCTETEVALAIRTSHIEAREAHPPYEVINEDREPEQLVLPDIDSPDEHGVFPVHAQRWSHLEQMQREVGPACDTAARKFLASLVATSAIDLAALAHELPLATDIAELAREVAVQSVEQFIDAQADEGGAFYRAALLGELLDDLETFHAMARAWTTPQFDALIELAASIAVLGVDLDALDDIGRMLEDIDDADEDIDQISAALEAREAQITESSYPRYQACLRKLDESLR